MATIYLTGNDGDFAFDSSTEYAGHIKTWAATLTRTSTVMTGFGDTGTRRRLGISDVTGSVGGHLKANSGNSSPYAGFLAGGAVNTDADGVAITLTNAVAGYGGGSVCKLQLTAVINSIAVNVDKNGDQTVTFNFEQSNGVVASETWDES
tara:strand:+ start:2563 stop:3012 length:450 start_codon:yes stop_codon:yes gene_type:complete